MYGYIFDGAPPAPRRPAQGVRPPLEQAAHQLVLLRHGDIIAVGRLGSPLPGPVGSTSPQRSQRTQSAVNGFGERIERIRRETGGRVSGPLAYFL